MDVPVYFGAYYRQTENTYRLTCLILDLDSAASTLSNSPLSPSLTTGAYTAILGPLVTAGAQQYLTQVAPNDNSTYWSLGYQFPSEETLSQFSLPLKDADGQIRYTPGVNASEWAMERVNNQDVWAVVIVNGNATMDALNAVSNGGQQYDRKHLIPFFEATDSCACRSFGSSVSLSFERGIAFIKQERLQHVHLHRGSQLLRCESVHCHTSCFSSQLGHAASIAHPCAYRA